jgi:hypothetical protein
MDSYNAARLGLGCVFLEVSLSTFLDYAKDLTPLENIVSLIALRTKTEQFQTRIW